MRKNIALIALATLTLTACQNGEEKKIEQAAYGYSKAMGEYQFDDAIPYASRLTRETTIPTFKTMLSFSDTNQLFANRPATITIKKVCQTSDTTAYALYHKHTPIKDIDDTVRLILEDGSWVVHSPIKPLPFVGTVSADTASTPRHTKDPRLLKDIEKDYNAKRQQKQAATPANK